MKTINLETEQFDLTDVLQLAEREPVLLLTEDGREFLVSEADDFAREVEALRASVAFQRFLDERSASQRRFSLDEIEREIEQELAAPSTPPVVRSRGSGRSSKGGSG